MSSDEEETSLLKKMMLSGKYATRFFDKDGHFLSALMSENIRQIYHIITLRDNEEIFIYNEDEGIWEPHGEISLHAIIKKIMGETYSKRLADRVIADIKASTLTDRRIFNMPLKLLPVKNGILDIEKRTLIPYSHKYHFTSKLPITYDPNAECPKFLKFLKQILPNENDRKIIQELFGYLLLRDYPYQVAFMFVGEGWNGKSTLINMMKRFLGPHNVSSVDLQSLDNDRFASSQLYQKYANLRADISGTALQKTGTFKMLTGGDLITAEKKFKNPFQFVNFAKLIFSANKIPYTNDDSIAFYRRWIIIKFNQQFKPELGNCDPKILDKITMPEELSGILNWALEGLERLQKQGHFSYKLKDEEIKDEYLRKASSLYAFIRDCVREEPGWNTPKDEFYRAYVKYCREHKLQIMSKIAVGRQITRYLPSVTTSYPKIEGRQRMCWNGIIVDGVVAHGEQGFEEPTKEKGLLE